MKTWRKLGLILKPQPQFEWMQSHMAVPVVEVIEGSLVRIYFCSRDRLNRSQIGFAELDVKKPDQILKWSGKPVLGLGELGTFDDNGVTPTALIQNGERKFLYYVGWNKGTTVRMHLFTGLAASKDGGKTFTRVSKAPILERNQKDPFLTATLSVLRENDLWRMWYVSGEKWEIINQESYPFYNIKYAESKDGIHWERTGHVCIELSSPEEHALARPCVLKEDGIYKMWFSHKGKDYRLGYAESKDGLLWKRMDEKVGIDVSPDSFDSQMIEYADVFNCENKKYMVYNGNEYGKAGIGLAVLE